MAVVYISGLMKAGTIRNTLVVAPASVLRSWENEACNVLTVCVPGAQIIVLSSTMSQKKRKSVLGEALHWYVTFSKTFLASRRQVSALVDFSPNFLDFFLGTASRQTLILLLPLMEWSARTPQP